MAEESRAIRRQLDERAGDRWVPALLALPGCHPLVAASAGAPVASAGKLAALAGAIAVAVTIALVRHHSPVVAVAAAAAGGHDELNAAQAAYRDGRYPEAIGHAQAALADGAPALPVWRIIGASRCFLGDAVGAGEARDQLDPPAGSS